MASTIGSLEHSLLPGIPAQAVRSAGSTTKSLLWLMRILCGAAVGVTGYLALAWLRSDGVAGCGSGRVWDCASALNSRWSKVANVSVSVPAFVLYATMLVSLFVCRLSRLSSRQKFAWGSVTVGAIAAGLAAVWFIGLQLFAVGHLCVYCMAAHACGLALCLLILWKRPLGAQVTSKLSGLSAIGVSLLIATQLLVAPRATFKIERYPAEPAAAPGTTAPVTPAPSGSPNSGSGPATTRPEAAPEVFEPPGASLDRMERTKRVACRRTLFRTASFESMMAILALLALMSGSAVAAEPAVKTAKTSTSENPQKQASRAAQDKVPAAAQKKATAKPAAGPRRLVNVAGGQIVLDVRHWPLIGRPEAKYVFVEMFDYTCPYCRATNQALHTAMERFGNDLAVVTLAVPLNPECNRAVGAANAEHAEACEIARIAIVVWRVDRRRFGAFHSWLCESARSAADARRYAAELVGEERVAAELARPYAGQYIAKHVELYERVGGGTLPKLLFPKSTVNGSVDSPDTLSDLVQREAGGTP